MYLPRMRLRSFIVAAVLFVCAAPAQAQFFRNNAFSFDLGWQGMGSTFDSIAGDPLWNINDQLTIGAGYTGAAGYQLWYDLHTSLGMSTVRITDLDIEPIVTLNIWTGIRYHFLEEGLRPFVSIAGQFLQVITASKNIPLNALFGNTPCWVGARLGGGVEYFFVEDQSLILDAQLAAYLGANSPPPEGIASLVLPSTLVRLAYQIYF